MMYLCCRYFLGQALLAFLLLVSACTVQYGLPLKGYGYPPGLSACAVRPGGPHNYTYYPRYEAYYHLPTRQFHYLNGKTWNVQPSIPGSTPQAVLNSPGVPFHFSQAPEIYHNAVRQAFPPSWTPGRGRLEDGYDFGRSGYELDRR